MSIIESQMLRTTGVVLLLGIGAMHFLQIVDTFSETPGLGVAYLLFIGACLAVAGGLLIRGGSRAWVAAGVIGLGAIGAYLFTRVLSTPFDNEDVGNWSCMLGLAALFVETSLLATAAYALGASHARRSQPVRASVDLQTRRRAAA